MAVTGIQGLMGTDMVTEPSTHPDSHGASPLGYGLVLLAGTFWSFGGILVREIEVANEWQILFYRSVTLVAILFVFFGVRNRGAIIKTFRAAGAVGVIAGLCLALTFISFIFSLTHTTVANTLFLLSSGPFMAALLGRIILGEKVQRATLVAMMGAVLGILVMVWEGVATGGLFGDLTALISALGFAVFTVALRRRRTVDMFPAVCWAGIFCTLFTGVLGIFSDHGLAIPVGDVLLSVIYGGAIGCGLTIYTIGSRSVPSAELILLSLTEVVLGPIWVWLGIGEVPSGMTLVGGAIVLGAITGQAVVGMRRRPPPIGVV
ncbi:MAG: EamA family transporter [Proteobacteria bacterium]|nr:EamA family transporter [Pseudomonadota bacterium]